MFKKSFHILAALLAFTLSEVTGADAKSPANTYDDMIRVEVLPGWRAADGTHMAALQLTLMPGWKTYWRAPGDAGIPPVMIWAGSRNLAAAQITWPTPKVFNQRGMTSIGYKDRVILPISITPKNAGKPVRLKLRLQIGVCNDVCVPAQFTLNQTLVATPAKRDPKIAAALAERPYSATEAGVKAVACTINLTPDGIRLRAEINMPPVGGREFVVFEANDTGIWSSEAKVTRKGRALIAETDLVHMNGGAFALDRSALRITILGKTSAVDIRGCS